MLTLHFERNVIAFVHVSWLDPDKIRRTTIVGSRKMLVYDDTAPQEKIRIYDKGVTAQNTTIPSAISSSRIATATSRFPRIEEKEPLFANASISSTASGTADAQHRRLLWAACRERARGGEHFATSMAA